MKACQNIPFPLRRSYLHKETKRRAKTMLGADISKAYTVVFEI
jgi:hypothetical protein